MRTDYCNIWQYSEQHESVWPGAAAAVVGAWPAELQQRCLQAALSDGSEPDAAFPAAALSTGCAPRALCIGVGGGALPLFLSHHFPGLLVDAVRPCSSDAAIHSLVTCKSLSALRNNQHKYG